MVSCYRRMVFCRISKCGLGEVVKGISSVFLWRWWTIMKAKWNRERRAPVILRWWWQREWRYGEYSLGILMCFLWGCGCGDSSVEEKRVGRDEGGFNRVFFLSVLCVGWIESVERWKGEVSGGRIFLSVPFSLHGVVAFYRVLMENFGRNLIQMEGKGCCIEILACGEKLSKRWRREKKQWLVVGSSYIFFNFLYLVLTNPFRDG